MKDRPRNGSFCFYPFQTMIRRSLFFGDFYCRFLQHAGIDFRLSAARTASVRYISDAFQTFKRTNSIGDNQRRICQSFRKPKFLFNP